MHRDVYAVVCLLCEHHIYIFESVQSDGSGLYWYLQISLLIVELIYYEINLDVVDRDDIAPRSEKSLKR